MICTTCGCTGPRIHFYIKDSTGSLVCSTCREINKGKQMSETIDAETARLIQEALAGDRGTDQKRIAETGVDFVGTLLRKNHDYGSSVWEVPMLAPKLDVATAILVRMTDKIKRIQSLMTSQAEVKSESIEDSIKDLGAYCLLYLARPKT